MSAPAPRLLTAVAVGGATGAVLRHLAGAIVPDGPGFAWTTFTVNVVGCATLALLGLLRVVGSSPVLAAAAGPGLLGGFTTFSTTSEQGRSLLAGGEPALAAAYLLGTLAACLAAVAAVSAAGRRMRTQGAR